MRLKFRRGQKDKMNTLKQSSNAGHKLKIDDISEEILLTDSESALVLGGVISFDEYGTCYWETLYDYSLCLYNSTLSVAANPVTVTPTDFGV